MAHVRGPSHEDDPTKNFDMYALVIVFGVLLWAIVHSNGLHRFQTEL